MKISRSRRCGFTLLEMLIVGMLGVLVAGFIGHAWRWYAQTTGNLQGLTLLTNELKIATETIAQDYGTAAASRTIDGDTFQIDIDGGAMDGAANWDSPDTVIEYALVNGNLVRRDLTAGTEVPIAGRIRSMMAATGDGKLTIRIVAEVHDLQQFIDLQLEGP